MTAATPSTRQVAKCWHRFRRLGLYVTPTMIEDDTRSCTTHRTAIRSFAGARALADFGNRSDGAHALSAVVSATTLSIGASGRGSSGNPFCDALDVCSVVSTAGRWEHVRETMRSRLSQRGCNYVRCADARESLDVARTAHAAGILRTAADLTVRSDML